MRPGRLPFQPLTDAVGTVMYERSRRTGVGWATEEKRWEPIPGNPTTILAELTGINRRQLTRWEEDGIPEEEADRIAVALGLHVCEIWPSWWPENGVELQEAPVVEADAPLDHGTLGVHMAGTDDTP